MLKWFRAIMPHEDRFFDLFDRHSQLVVSGAEALRKLLAGGGDVERYCGEIVNLERQADAITDEVMTAVRKSFVTPFDRSDIQDLIQSMDDAIDMMRKTVKTVTLYEQSQFEPRMQELGELIVQSAHLNAEAIPLLSKVATHAPRLTELTSEVRRMESRADELHDDGLKALFQRHGHSDPMAFHIGSEIYGQLEKVMDRFEDVANEISGIVVENV